MSEMKTLEQHLTIIDEEGNEVVAYDKPIKYEFNYQPISSYSEIVEFGEKANIMQKAVSSKR